MKNTTTKKILIVEDDLVLSDMYKLKLEKEGFTVQQAIDGLEGLSILKDFTPDAILLDIMMPSMDGFETLQAIKNHTSCQSKIIMFTNVIDKDKIDKAKKYGANDYVLKSDTNPSDLVKKIKKILKKENNCSPEVYIQPGLNIFKIKNPFIEGWEDLEISVNVKI